MVSLDILVRAVPKLTVWTGLRNTARAAWKMSPVTKIFSLPSTGLLKQMYSLAIPP